MFKRKLNLEREQPETFFLWGPRQTGKTTLLKSVFKDSLWLDLLKSDQYRKYMQSPNILREIVQADSTIKHVVIDEIQKVPDLLDEIHWLLENTKVNFALCGSSARKIKRGHANLLGGRAIRYELRGLSAVELAEEFDLVRLLNNGYLPRHYLAKNPRRLINSYVSDYLKEEIAAEGLVRNLPGFADFLGSAALSDGEIVNFSTIARDCGVSSKTVKSYFEILEDTLLASFLPVYRKKMKRRTIQAPKFYFSDIGVVNYLCKRGTLEPGSELFGKAFENWVYHELQTYNAYAESFARISYWRLASGIEVDFIIDDFSVAIEAKATPKVKTDYLKGLRQLEQETDLCQQKIVVCLEPIRRQTDDGILILPYQEFIRDLWQGDLFF
jgi:predicted AAA+ superfamily ATPase